MRSGEVRRLKSPAGEDWDGTLQWMEDFEANYGPVAYFIRIPVPLSNERST
jgi:hypothetical protein